MASGVFYLLSTPEKAIALRHDEKNGGWRCWASECCRCKLTCEHVQFAQQHYTDPEIPSFDDTVGVTVPRASLHTEAA